MTAAALLLGGELRGRLHVLPVRVYYEDTDAGGVVYHSNYLNFCERGRTEMLRAIGIELSQIQKNDNLVFVVVRGDVAWRRPARLDDSLTVETALIKIGRASVSLRQTVRRNDEEIVHFNVDVACMDLTSSKATPLPKDLRTKFEAFVSEV